MFTPVTNLYVIINGDASDLSSKNLGPLGEMDFNVHVQKDQQVNMNFKNGEEILATVFYKVVEVVQTNEADKLIMVSTGRKDYK